MNLTILLADDHPILRQGLKSLLESEGDLHVVAEASNGRDAVDLAGEFHPDVVLMDIGMPVLNGIEATRQIIANDPQARVLGLSMHSDRRFMDEMLKAGAKGYLLKDGSFEELAAAIRSVVAGQLNLGARMTRAVVENYFRQVGGLDGSPDSSAFSRLSPREREVLQLMSEGRATKEIAMDLRVSIKTVETHRRQIMEKLDIYSVAELTKYAIREGLTSLDA